MGIATLVQYHQHRYCKKTLIQNFPRHGNKELISSINFCPSNFPKWLSFHPVPLESYLISIWLSQSVTKVLLLLVKGKGLMWGHSQDMEPMMRWSSSLALYFESILHSWALPIVKHEAKLIMNLNICKSGGIRGGGFSCIILTIKEYSYY
jgi:hypothetical protein